jgi:hypothetical protein
LTVDGDVWDKDEADPNQGWNHAALIYRSRRGYQSGVRAEDLLLPSGHGNLRLFGMSVLMSMSLTLIYVWPPLWLGSILISYPEKLYGGLLALAFVVITIALYFLAAHETRRDREYVTRI